MAAPLRGIFFLIQRNFFACDPRVRLAPRDLIEDHLSRVKTVLPNGLCRSKSRLAKASREITKAVVGSLDTRVFRGLEKLNRAFKYNRFLNQRTYLTRAGSRALDALDRILLAYVFGPRPAFRARRLRLFKQGYFTEVNAAESNFGRAGGALLGRVCIACEATPLAWLINNGTLCEPLVGIFESVG
jgi:hypothetical protein